MRTWFHPVARALVALIFVLSGFTKLAAFSATAAMMGQAGFPAPALFLAGAIAVEILGGLALLAGFRARWAALALLLFLIPATVIFHLLNHQTLEVLKNLAIMGGLLKFHLDGAGAFALDNLSAPERTDAQSIAA